MKVDSIILESYITDGWITKRKHPQFDLYIYNYTPKTQFQRYWDPITISCRGLIVDGEGNVIAKPFDKFFNLSELDISDIPKLPFDVFDKLDGSLGIMYFWENKPYIATRGSFESDMAIHATNVLYSKYKHVIPNLNPTQTYLFEIIYPQNVIVINYGDTDDIILLTIKDTETSQETLEDIGFPMVQKYDGINNIEDIKLLERDDKEGVVLRFTNGYRIKVKFAEYLRLHRIVSRFSNKLLWLHLSQELPITEFLECVPDEFYNYVKKVELDLKTQFIDIMRECKLVYKEYETIKETAEYFKTQKYPSVLFCLLKGIDPSPLIWKLIKPKYEKPYLIDVIE